MLSGVWPSVDAGAQPSLPGASPIFLPLTWRGVSRTDLPLAPTAAATPAPAATATPTATAAPTDTPTIPPTTTPFPTYTPTAVAQTGRIHGRLTVEEQPAPPGLGLPGQPQIELRRRAGGAWTTVARTTTDAGGRFEFLNPPALGEGEVYQVWWINNIEDVIQGSELYLHRWWSAEIDHFGPGDEVDVGVFEIADLHLLQPCNDCGQSLPITFKWQPRRHASERYRWSLFADCSNRNDRPNSYRTASLGRGSEYNLLSLPPGFRLGRNCWYIYIEAGANGTGWSLDASKIIFLPTPLKHRPQ